MVPVRTNILVKFARELLGEIYFCVQQDVLAFDGLVEGQRPWNHGFYCYLEPADNGTIERINTSSPPTPLNIALMTVHWKAQEAVSKNVWWRAMSRLRFSASPLP